VPSSRLNVKLAVVVVVSLALGLTAWYLLHRAADAPLYSPPPERQGRNAPFIMTPDLTVEKMVEAAELKESDLVYDLGCGDGRIVITAAMMSGCRGVGFDIDPQRVAEAKENAVLHDVADRVQIVEQDLFTVDLSQADVAMMYLLPWMMNKLLPQLQQMKDGCRIVSHAFWIDGVEPDRIIDLVDSESRRTTSIYVYRTPLRLNPAMEKGKPPEMPEGQSETIVAPEALRRPEGS